MAQACICPSCGKTLERGPSTAPCPHCSGSISTVSEETLADGSPLNTVRPGAAGPESTSPPRRSVEDGDVYATAVPGLDHATALPSGSRRAPVVAGYKIQGLLGEGAMGVVYRAHQILADRPVALKMIRGDALVRDDQLERFRIEAQSVASLRHPNVVQVYDVGDVDGLPYFSLELLEGGSLRDRLSKATMRPPEAATLFESLARGIEAAHLAGIVHRDLKPANILFDLDGTPKIADFGLAKRLEEVGQTLSGQVVGTPNYMAPEQALGRTRQIGPAADIYSLGVVLYEALAGRPPFRGTTVSETLMLVVNQAPLPPSRLQSRLPRDLETICLKCLEKEPARRYRSARELADDLRRFLEGDPIQARPTPAWERAAKWARHHPTAASLVTLTISMGILFASAAIRERARADRLRREAASEFLEGQERLARGELEDARVSLARLAARSQAEPALKEFVRRVAAPMEEAGRRLAARAARETDVARLTRFTALRDEAVFRDALDAGLDPGGRPEQVRDSARAALAVFGFDGLTLAAWPATLSTAEREEAASGCRLVLLVLAEAVARPSPGEDPRHQASEALRILDAYAALKSSTRAYKIRRAEYLERAGEADAARVERAEAEQTEPADAFDFLLLGREAYRRGDLSAALRHFDAALQKRPDLFWAQCLSAVCCLNGTPVRPAEAKAALTACLQQRPGYPWLYLLRGTAFGHMGTLAASASVRLPSQAASLTTEAESHFASAEADFRIATTLGLDGGLLYALHMDRGVVRFQRGRPAEALADFERAVELDPTRYNAFASMAQALGRLGRHSDAVARLGMAINLRPELAELYRDRARLRLEGATDPKPTPIEEALADLAEAVRREPSGRNAADDHARRGRLLRRLGRPGEALTSCDAALALAPGLADAHRDRAAALLELRRFGEVEAACDAALASGPATAELQELRGVARVGRGDFAGAADAYSQSLALRPGRSSAHAERGWAYYFANAPELSLRDFEEVVRLKPTDPEGYSGKAAAEVRLRRHAAAAADAEESLRRGDLAPRRLYAAARTFAQASGVAAAEVSARGRNAIREASDYEVRARRLLVQAYKLTPEPERPAFWRDIVEPDRALETLRRRGRLVPPASNPERR